MHRLTLIFLLSFLLVPLTACGLTGGPLEGKVLEAGTNKPIPGAIVVVRWTGSLFAFAESQTKCVHVETATTDAQGHYKIALWVGTFPGLIQDLRPDVTAYKTGYVRSPEYFKQQSYRKNVELLEVFKGASGERLKQLRQMNSATGCGAAGESKMNQKLFAKALYEEALTIAKTVEEKKMVDNLLFSLEIIELGYEAAERRDIDRSRGRK